ncbi:MAG: glycoside hydrolase family 18 [Proteiniphilum sp.]|jgi:hypothetical protein|nr:glycoside hydrolase family 18 [Proteiniphilum sp.]
MKVSIKKYVSLLTGIMFLFSCSDWTDNKSLELQKPAEKSEEYYRNLKAYKASDHQVTFGWFGGWNPDAPSRSRSLSSVPDSVDIISIWGDNKLDTDAKRRDLRYVQEKYGTKVTFTIFAHDLPKGYEDSDDGIRQYARDVTVGVFEYGYDGLDLDYEPGYAGYNFYFMNKDKMEVFVKTLGEILGPKSGSGKLLIIDGVPGYLKPGLSEYFDYGIVQSYYSGGYYDLQNRFMQAAAAGWKPDQYIFTEDFERHWNDGGASFLQRNGSRVRSLEGMAGFQIELTVDGKTALYRKKGCGTYHMEYDYNNTPDYKYLRQAIQIMNPAGKTPIPSGIITVAEKEKK